MIIVDKHRLQLQMHMQDCQDSSQQISGLEVLVEQPFTTDFSLKAPPQVQSIMLLPLQPPLTALPASRLPQAEAGLPQGSPKPLPVIPLGSPAIMVACIDTMARCEVSDCYRCKYATFFGTFQKVLHALKNDLHVT